MKLTKLEKWICKVWDKIESHDPDISTERLFAMVEDYINNHAKGRNLSIDAGDISYALAKKHDPKQFAKFISEGLT